MKINCMIDLETMGKRFDAPILSIGAVLFDIESGRITESFYRAIDVEDAFRWGRADGDTVRWWMKQSEAARADAVSGLGTLGEALADLAALYPARAPVWGNGPTFDISILEYGYARVGANGRPPWAFWDVRDCRTMKDLGDALGFRVPKIAGTAHNALDDATHQAKWVSEIWQPATGKRGIVSKSPPAPDKPVDFDKLPRPAAPAATPDIDDI